MARPTTDLTGRPRARLLAAISMAGTLVAVVALSLGCWPRDHTSWTHRAELTSGAVGEVQEKLSYDESFHIIPHMLILGGDNRKLETTVVLDGQRIVFPHRAEAFGKLMVIEREGPFLYWVERIDRSPDEPWAPGPPFRLLKSDAHGQFTPVPRDRFPRHLAVQNVDHRSEEALLEGAVGPDGRPVRPPLVAYSEPPSRGFQMSTTAALWAFLDEGYGDDVSDLHLPETAFLSAFRRKHFATDPRLAPREAALSDEDARQNATDYVTRALALPIGDPALLREDDTQTRLVDVALLFAVGDGHAPFVDALLARGGDVEHHHSFSDRRPLHVAASAGRLDLVTRLVTAGADVNAPCNDGTAIAQAANYGSTEVVAYLLKAGADPDQKSLLLGSAREVATARGYRHMLRLLE